MDKKLHDLINDQINKELYSAYAYYAVAEYYRSKALDGFHKHFEKQAQEEIEHAEKFAEYLQDNDAEVILKPIDVLNKKFSNLREPLEFQAEHEAYVTSLIHALYRHAREIDDLAALNFLNWYIEEQMEEEKSAKEMLEKYDLFGKDGGLGLYKLDKEFGE